MEGREEVTGAWPGESDSERRISPLYHVVVPEQKLVVRVNGLRLDEPEDGYLPAVKPYGLLGMAWAIWHEVTDVGPKESFAGPKRNWDRTCLRSGQTCAHSRTSRRWSGR